MGRIIPYIMENKSYVWNHQPGYVVTTTKLPRHFQPRQSTMETVRQSSMDFAWHDDSVNHQEMDMPWAGAERKWPSQIWFGKDIENHKAC